MKTDSGEISGIPRLHRRRLQYSLRSLLIFVAIVAVVLGCVAVPWHRAQRQRGAVSRIESNGGHVTYDYEFGDDGSNPRSAAIRTGMATKMFGRRLLRHGYVGCSIRC